MAISESVDQQEQQSSGTLAESVDVRGALLGQAAFGPQEVKTLERAISGHQSAEVRTTLNELDGRINAGEASDRDLTAAGVAAFLLGRHDLADGYLRRVTKDAGGLASFYHGEALIGLRKFEAAEA